VSRSNSVVKKSSELTLNYSIIWVVIYNYTTGVTTFNYFLPLRSTSDRTGSGDSGKSYILPINFV